MLSRESGKREREGAKIGHSFVTESAAEEEAVYWTRISALKVSTGIVFVSKLGNHEFGIALFKYYSR